MQLSLIDVVSAVLLVGIVTIGNESAVQRQLFANRDNLNLQALEGSLLAKNTGKFSAVKFWTHKMMRLQQKHGVALALYWIYEPRLTLFIFLFSTFKKWR